MNKIVLFSLMAFVFFSGCETKRQYFEPTKIAAEVKFDGVLPAKIKEVGRYGAILENGQVITKEGISETIVPAGYSLVGKADNAFLVAGDCGVLKIINKADSSVLYERKFDDTNVASAALENEILALVTSGNEIYIINVKEDKIIMQKKYENIYAVDYRMALPYFLSSLILFPTLDGKIVIVDKINGQIIRDVVISSQTFFNNIIFLDVIQDRMIAATSKKLISINPQKINFLDADIREIIALENRVYILTKDGRVILANADLEVLKERKFEFAIFSGGIWGEYLYILEKEGYLIAVDKDLTSSNVYELSDSIEDMSFSSKDTIYYKDKYFKLNLDKVKNE